MMVKLTPGQERFARLVASGTGLSLLTVRTWVTAESGGRSDRDGNPLSIMRDGRLADFKTPQAAASQTVRLLRSGNQSYAHILKVAHDPHATAQDELAAIAQSDWEATGYRQGTLLQGAYTRVTGNASMSTTHPASIISGVGGAAGDAAGAVGGAIGGLIPDIPNPVDWVRDATGWVGEQAGKAFLYLAFTVLALMLIVLGAMRALGTGPLELAGAARGARAARPSTGEIPF